MSNYTQNTNFTAKDSLATGNPSKTVRGAEFDAEFAEIESAIASKEDASNKEQANGYAGLDGGGRILASRLPAAGTFESLAITNGNIFGASTGSAYTVGANPNASITAGGFIQFYGSTNPAPSIVSIGTAGSERLRVGATGNVSINPPGSGVALAVNGVSGGTAQTWADGTRSAGLSLSASRVDFGSTTGDILGFLTGSTRRMEITAAGNVTVNAPSSGAALTVNGGPGAQPLSIVAGADNFGRVRVTDTGTTANHYTGVESFGGGGVAGNFRGGFLIHNSDSGAHIFAGGNLRQSISGAGNVTINAPNSGVALTVNQSGSTSGIINTSASGNNSTITLTQTGVQSWNLYNPAGSTDFRINNGSGDRVVISTAGNVLVNAPSSGAAIQAAGQILASSSGGVASLSVDGGTQLQISAQNAGLTYLDAFRVSGSGLQIRTSRPSDGALIERIGLGQDGSVSVPGSLSVGGQSVLTTADTNYVVTVRNSAHTFGLADRNGLVVNTGVSAQTWTIPLNSVVNFPVGAKIIVSNRTTIGPPSGGNVTIAPAMFVSLFSPGVSGSYTLQHGETRELIQTAINEWVVK